MAPLDVIMLEYDQALGLRMFPGEDQVVPLREWLQRQRSGAPQCWCPGLRLGLGPESALDRATTYSFSRWWSGRWRSSCSTRNHSCLSPWNSRLLNLIVPIRGQILAVTVMLVMHSHDSHITLHILLLKLSTLYIENQCSAIQNVTRCLESPRGSGLKPQ